MKKNEVKDLVDQIIEAEYKVNSFYDEQPTRPKGNKSASNLELEQLDSHLAKKGFIAPDIYIKMLSVYNGVENLFADSFSLMSINEVIEEDYGILDEMIDDFPSCCEFVIAGGNTTEFIGFDISESSEDGGYQVVWVSDEGDEWRSENFEAFLKDYLLQLESNILSQEKDRKNLPE